MQTKYQMTQIRSVIAVFLLIGAVCFSTFGAGIAPSARAQENFTPTATPSRTYHGDNQHPTPMGATISSESIPEQLIIKFSTKASDMEKETFLEAHGGSVVKRIDALNTLVIRVPKNGQNKINSESSVVESIEPNYYVTALDEVIPNDPRYPEQWALPAIGAPSAWGQMLADEPKVTIAVIDSGTCASHPDLDGRILEGWDFLENDPLPQDDFGHGCSVAGVIAANMSNGIGIAGVAPNAQIMPLRVLNASGVGSYFDVAAAIVYATEQGAQVINLSLGGANPSSTLEGSIDYAISKGVIIVAAAGNSGIEGPVYPAAYPDVIAVGSVDPDLEHSTFSNHGSQIDIWAPGHEILTTKRDGSYGLVSGTSFAAAYVSGAGAITITRGETLSPSYLGNLWLGAAEPTASTPTVPISITSSLTTTAIQVISTPTATQEPIDTALWQEYIDPVYGYAIKIPFNWFFTPTPLDQYGGTAVFTSYDPAQYTADELPPRGKIDIGVYGVDKPDHIPLEAWVLSSTNFGATVVDSKEIIVAKSEALQVKYNNSIGSYIIVYIPRAAKVYYFTFPLIDSTSTNLIEEILATFNFVREYKKVQPDSVTLFANEPIFNQLEFPPEAQSSADYILPFTGEEILTNGPGCSQSHSIIDSEALDFGLSYEPVFASRRGWAGYYPNTDYGNLIKIIHPDGEISWYAHLSTPRIPNDNSLHYVETGQVIAISGNTGPLTTGAHLHFHVRNHEDTATINVRNLPVIQLYNPNAEPPCMPVGQYDGIAYGPPALFENTNYGGKAQLMSTSVADLRNIWMGHDNASSLWIAAPWSMRVCKDENYRGSCKIYSPSSFGDEISIPNLGNERFQDGTIIDENITSVEAGLFCIASFSSEVSAQCGGPTPTPLPSQPTATLPPPSGGIELVSVSSHVVRPGQQFDPSITIRRVSGELVANRDHLHATPEDTSNTFGAWPVQPLRTNVPIGGTYTFNVNNDSGFRMTAPSSPGQYRSVWQMRVGGNHVGPQAVINITVQSDPIVPNPTPLPINCDNPPDGIILYEFSDFRGRCQLFTHDVMYLGNTYFGDDVASSLRVVGNWGVTIFKDPDWNGTWENFSSNDNNLSDNLIGDNQASSLRVGQPGNPCATLPPGVTLYRGRDFTGISQTFNRDVMFLGNEPIGNDTVNSLRVCGNYRVTLYRDPDWTGFSEEFTGSDSNLSDNPINNPDPNTSSLRIVDATDACNSLPSGATLYTETNFGGRSETFGSDVMFLGNTPLGNDVAKSIRVCGHWTVTLFRDPDWNGLWENFNSSDSNLSDNPIGNQTVSSLRLVNSFDFCRTLAPGVTLYRGRDFTGIAQTFNHDVMFLGNEPIGNDTVNSIRLCGYNARLYRDPDWQGFFEDFTGREESNLTDNPINNPNATTSSLRVWPIPPPPPSPTPTTIPSPTPLAERPDLVPFQGSDWAFPLVPSAVSGNHLVSVLYAGQITYLDWGIFNNSAVNVVNPFKVRLFVDNVQIREFSYTSLNANSYHGIDDWNIFVDSPGYHTLRISVDSNNQIVETTESNNSWEGSFYWNSTSVPPVPTSRFADVPENYWARSFIERLHDAGITGGCGVNPLLYCPEGTVTRAQMAVFLERGIHGSNYNPPSVGTGTGFSDVPSTYWAAAWIKQLAADGITGGCGTGAYCPEAPVTRAQMAVFLLRSKHGASYIPPAVGSSTGFTDVQPAYWAAAWIKQLVAEGITSGCGTNTYCPEDPVTRAQMAVFLVKTFNLP